MKFSKILFINPNQYQSPPVIPLGIEYLGHALKSKGYTIRVLDLCFSNAANLEIKKAIDEFVPDVICLTVRNNDSVLYPDTELFLPALKEMIAEIRKLTNAQVIIGGAALPSNPQGILDYLHADLAFVGPAEESLPDYLSSDSGNSAGVISNQRIVTASIHTDKSRIYSFRPQRPAYFDYQKYLAKGGIPGFETHKGCNSGCIFCMERCTRAVFRDIDDVVFELKELVAAGFDHFILADAEFNENLGYSVTLLERMVAEKLPFKWSLYMKPVNYSLKMLELLVRSNAYLVTLSVDTFQRSEEYWKDIENMVNLARGAGLKVSIDLLTGFPYETREDLQRALDFFMKLNPFEVVLNVFFRLYKTLPLTDMILRDPELMKHVVNYRDPSFIEPVFFNQVDLAWLKTKLANSKIFRIAGAEKVVNYQKA